MGIVTVGALTLYFARRGAAAQMSHMFDHTPLSRCRSGVGWGSPNLFVLAFYPLWLSNGSVKTKGDKSVSYLPSPGGERKGCLSRCKK